MEILGRYTWSTRSHVHTAVLYQVLLDYQEVKNEIEIEICHNPQPLSLKFVGAKVYLHEQAVPEMLQFTIAYHDESAIQARFLV